MAVPIILVDDHNLVRRGLAALLHNEGRYRVVAEARNGEEALRLARHTDAELMILDLAMPRLNGIETLRRLKDINPCLRVLVLSMYDDEQFVIQALRHGAVGYILKQSLDEELFQALEVVERGERYISPMINTGALDEFADPCTDLTNREREVLQLIVEGHTTQEIAQLLAISAHTANRHRANLMHKLDVHNQIELVRAAMQQGLVVLPR